MEKIPEPSVESAMKKRWLQLFLLLWCILLIACRETRLLTSPRLWAEEGKIFYSYALHHSVMDIFLTPQVGYLTLFNSIISFVQARIFPVELAPVVSTYAGFLVQLIPVLIILFTTHPFWNSPLKKMLLSTFIILVTPPELWLNTTNSHFIFGLTTFLILVIPAEQLSPVKKWLFRILLVLGNLTGPASMFLTPVFFIQAYYEKSREKYIQAGIQTIFALVQGSIVVYSLFFRNSYHRLQEYNLSVTVYNFFIDHFSLNVIFQDSAIRHAGGILMAVYFIYLFVKRRKNRTYVVFMLSFIISALFATAGSLQMEGSPRYGYITTCIFLMLLIADTWELFSNKQKLWFIPAIILGFVFVINVIDFRSRMEEVYSPEYPHWKDEMVKWHADPSYHPKIHPDYNNTWYVEL
jgi:hypothetical protein